MAERWRSTDPNALPPIFLSPPSFHELTPEVVIITTQKTDANYLLSYTAFYPDGRMVIHRAKLVKHLDNVSIACTSTPCDTYRVHAHPMAHDSLLASDILFDAWK